MLLTGCATTPPPGPATAPAPNTTTAVPDSPGLDDPATATEDDTRNTGARLAVETAEAAAAGRSTALAASEQGWTATVLSGTVSRDVALSPDGVDVTADAPSPAPPSADLVARLDDAPVTMRQAMDTVLDQIPGDFVSARLEPDAAPGGGLRWEVTVDYDEHTVALSVDAGTGEVRE